MTVTLSRTPDALYEALDVLLTYSAQLLDLIPAQPGCEDLDGAPEARYITPGLPAISCCPSLWAFPGLVAEAPTGGGAILNPGHRSGSLPRMTLPTLNILIARCAPAFRDENGNEPTAEEQAAVARQVCADGWMLWTQLSRAIREDKLFPKCLENFFDGMSSLDPEGNCAGWLLTFRTSAIPAFDVDLPDPGV